MTTFPPSPAQGETAGVTLADQLSFVEMITKARIFISDQHDALIAIAASLRLLDVARQQLAAREAECRVKERALTSLSQQLAEMRGAISTARAYVARIGSQYAPYMDDMDAGSNRATVAILDRALASQPSRGKCEELRCHGSHKVWVPSQGDVTCEPCLGCPDCAQPERQGADNDALRQLHAYWNGSQPRNAVKEQTAQFLFQYLQILDPNCRFSVEKSGVLCELRKGHDGPCGFIKQIDERPSPPPTDDIVAGLRHLRETLSAKHALNVLASLEPIDRAIAALSEKGWHSSHKMDSHCIACGMSTEDERIKQACDP